MLIRAFSKLIVFVGPLLIFGYMFFVYFDGEHKVAQAISWSKDIYREDEIAPSREHEPEQLPLDDVLPTSFAVGPEGSATLAFLPRPTSSSILEFPSSSSSPSASLHSPIFPIDIAPASSSFPELPSLPTQSAQPSSIFPIPSSDDAAVDTTHQREIFSVSTPDRKFFSISFGHGFPALNPNIIPHPHHPNTWIIVAQRAKPLATLQDGVFEELVCNAQFQSDGSLACITPPTVLPVLPTSGPNCNGKLAHFSLNVGPHDMRVFYGPEAPYAIFGTQSAYACFGLWAQDFRTLSKEFGVEALSANVFGVAKELQRPPPWHEVEKNWFLFWDTHGQAYVHHDVEPKRVFAKVEADGSVGPDLAPLAAANDDACMAKYMPKPAQKNENLHQATNSLSISMCKRADPTCQPTDSNTFLFTIFQHKKFEAFHAVYEPYLLLFNRNAPFATHAISTRPLWIHGRGVLHRHDDAGMMGKGQGHAPDEAEDKSKQQSEMFYVTSMSWKESGMRYQGYVDDVLFLAFGIEDERTGGLDVVAGDLLQDLGLCFGV